MKNLFFGALSLMVLAGCSGARSGMYGFPMSAPIGSSMTVGQEGHGGDSEGEHLVGIVYEGIREASWISQQYDRGILTPTQAQFSFMRQVQELSERIAKAKIHTFGSPHRSFAQFVAGKANEVGTKVTMLRHGNGAWISEPNKDLPEVLLLDRQVMVNGSYKDMITLFEDLGAAFHSFEQVMYASKFKGLSGEQNLLNAAQEPEGAPTTKEAFKAKVRDGVAALKKCYYSQSPGTPWPAALYDLVNNKVLDELERHIESSEIIFENIPVYDQVTKYEVDMITQKTGDHLTVRVNPGRISPLSVLRGAYKGLGLHEHFHGVNFKLLTGTDQNDLSYRFSAMVNMCR